MTLKMIRDQYTRAGWVTRANAARMLGRGDGSSVEALLIRHRVPRLVIPYEHPGEQDRQMTLWDGVAVIGTAARLLRERVRQLEIGEYTGRKRPRLWG